MLQELQKDSSVTSGMMQKLTIQDSPAASKDSSVTSSMMQNLTIQDSPAASKSAEASTGQQQQEPVALYSAGYASGMEKGGFSADKPSGRSEPPCVNKLSPRMQQTWTESPRMQLTGRESTRTQLTQTESPRMQSTRTESPQMQLTRTESHRMQSTRTESLQMQLTRTESHRMQLPQTEQRNCGDPVLAPTYQASSSRMGQQLNSQTHLSSAVSTSLNAGTNQGLGTKPGSTARGKPLYEIEMTPSKEKTPGDSLKPTNPDSVQGKERRGWETKAVESSLTDADVHYAGHLIMEENWDDECNPFPKCYVGNFKPAKTIFSSCDRAEEDAAQPKCLGASGRSKAVIQSQAPGCANPSSRGRKWQETKQGYDKGKCTCRHFTNRQIKWNSCG